MLCARAASATRTDDVPGSGGRTFAADPLHVPAARGSANGTALSRNQLRVIVSPIGVVNEPPVRSHPGALAVTNTRTLCFFPPEPGTM